MATTESDLKTLEQDVLENLQDDAGGIEAEIEQAASAPEEQAPDEPVVRIAIAIAFPVIATAVMTGGVFTGPSPRIYGAVAGLMGIGLAIIASRQRRLSTTLAVT